MKKENKLNGYVKIRLPQRGIIAPELSEIYFNGKQVVPTRQDKRKLTEVTYKYYIGEMTIKDIHDYAIRIIRKYRRIQQATSYYKASVSKGKKHYSVKNEYKIYNHTTLQQRLQSYKLFKNAIKDDGYTINAVYKVNYVYDIEY